MSEWPHGYGLCHCGCGEKTDLAPQTHRSRGWVNGEPVRYVRGHQARAANRVLTALRRAERKYEERDCGYETPCWVWLKSLNPNGYGQLRREGASLAHRQFYEEKYGPVPADRPQLDHLCRNRACVNPDHLEPVTNRENQRRGSATRITAETARAIKERVLRTGEIQATATLFGVGRGTVQAIKYGTSWKDIEC